MFACLLAMIFHIQVKTLIVACGVGRMAETKAKGNAGAYAVSNYLPSLILYCLIVSSFIAPVHIWIF